MRKMGKISVKSLSYKFPSPLCIHYYLLLAEIPKKLFSVFSIFHSFVSVSSLFHFEYFASCQPGA